MRSVARRPSRSNRHNSTFVALAENSAKFVPRPSQVAPSGCENPAATWPLRVFGNEKDGSKGWDDNAKLRSVTRDNGRYRPGVPHVTSAIDRGIGIQHFSPAAGERHADAVVVQGLRGEIDDDHAKIGRAHV